MGAPRMSKNLTSHSTPSLTQTTPSRSSRHAPTFTHSVSTSIHRRNTASTVGSPKLFCVTLLTTIAADFSFLNKFFDNLRHSTISTLEVFITTSRQSLFPARVIEMAWRSIRAVSPSVTTIRIGISTTCVECFLPSRGDDLGPHWPILIDTLRDHTCSLTVQFGEWGASSQTGLLMADSFATPKGTIIPSSHELKNTLQPCSSLLRDALTKGLERVITGACIKIM